jgi:hypothetical protein
MQNNRIQKWKCDFLLPPHFIPIIYVTMTQVAHAANTTPYIYALMESTTGSTLMFLLLFFLGSWH